jgi:kinesin family protein 1
MSVRWNSVISKSTMKHYGSLISFFFSSLCHSDCLAPKSVNLKVREDPKEGTFVTNLTTVLVETFEDVLSLISTGNLNRSVASTKANIHSSRSHAIVTLSVKQKFREAPKDGLLTSALRQKLSRIHLVDLAGSERVTNSGAIGIRLREANNINKRSVYVIICLTLV